MRAQIIRWYQRMRMAEFWLFSDCKRVSGKPNCGQPVQMTGTGRIEFGERVQLGYFPSPHALTGYIYLEVRGPEASIEFGDDVFVNNNSLIVSNGAGIVIGRKVIFGSQCEVMDSDFHGTHPSARATNGKQGRVIIGDNVWVASNVKILKGVTIGENSVIGNGALVSRSIPANVLAFGNPIQFRPLLTADPSVAQRAVAG